MKIIKYIAAAMVCASMVAVPMLAFAQESNFTIVSSKDEGGVVSADCIKCGACTICDLVSVLSRTLRYLLGVSGALALGLFMWGAWSLLTSAGVAEKVESGKKTLTGTTIGLAIILIFSWAWPQWVIVALVGAPEAKPGEQAKALTIFGGDEWWLTPCHQKNSDNLGQKCKDRPEREIAPTATGSCIDPATKATIKAGSYSIGADGKPDPKYICDENGRVQEPCTSEGDCTMAKGGNFCSKPTGGNNLGYCIEVRPGYSCDPDNTSSRGCPREYITDINFVIPFSTPFSSMLPSIVLSDKASLYCDPNEKRCLINDNSSCKNYETLCIPGFSACVNGECTAKKLNTGDTCRSCRTNWTCRGAAECPDLACPSPPGICKCTPGLVVDGNCK